MFISMNLLPHDETFFGLFEQHTSLIRKASELFAAGLSSGFEAVCATSPEIKILEERGDGIVRQVNQHLHKTFLTPFDPEDVRALAAALDDVLDAIEHTTFRITAHKITPLPSELVEFGQIVRDSCTLLQRALENVIRKEPVLQNCLAIGDLEKRADLLERRVMVGLFESKRNAIDLLKHKELLEIAERITDRRDDVANLLEHVSGRG